MKTKMKRIINLIILIIAAIVAFIFVKSLPGILMGTTGISKVESTTYAYTENASDFLKRCKQAYDSDDASKLVKLDIERLKSYSPKDAIERDIVKNILGSTSLATLKNWAVANSNKAFDPQLKMSTWNDYYDRYMKKDASIFTEIPKLASIDYTYTDYLNLANELKNSPYSAYSTYRIAIKNRSEFEEVKEWTKKEWEKAQSSSSSGGSSSGGTSSSGGSSSGSSSSGNTSSNIPTIGGFNGITEEQNTERHYFNLNRSTPENSSFVIITWKTLFPQNYKDGSYWRVIEPNAASQIYCASKGKSLSGNSDYFHYYSSVKEHADKGSESRHTYLNDHADKPEEYQSYAYYFKWYSRKANFYEAFILTWPGEDDKGWNEWDPVKQEAVWDMPTLSNNVHAPKKTTNGVTAEVLETQAVCYEDFMNKITANNNRMVVADRTDQTQVQKNINYTTKDYVVGPFKIDYISGDYNLVFGGISDMYIIGENTKRINIESIILVDPVTGIETEVKTNYFMPTGRGFRGTQAEGLQGELDRGNYNLVDPYPQSYPDPNQEFYVKYKSTSDEKIEKLHIDFEWMEASSTITYYNSVRYVSKFEENHHDSFHWHPRGQRKTI